MAESDGFVQSARTAWRRFGGGFDAVWRAFRPGAPLLCFDAVEALACREGQPMSGRVIAPVGYVS